MTATQETNSSRNKSIMFNRIMHGGFVLMSLYFLLVSKDLGTAMSNLGIALIFDPFDQTVMWNNRPLYQRVWLFVHVSLVLLAGTYLLLTSFNII